MRPGRTPVFFERKPCSCCCSQLLNVSVQEWQLWQKYPPLVLGKCRWGECVESFEAYWNTRNQCWFLSTHSCFSASMIKTPHPQIHTSKHWAAMNKRGLLHHCNDCNKKQISSDVTTINLKDIWQWFIFIKLQCISVLYLLSCLHHQLFFISVPSFPSL